MRVVLIRSTSVMPDPPVEKMADTLIDEGHQVIILAWDRDNSYKEKHSSKQLLAHQTRIIHFGIPAQYMGGIKANLKGLTVFQFRIMQWLISHRKEYDAVHAFDFDTGLAAMLCSKILRKKFIYHILDYYTEGHVIHGKLLNTLIEFLEIRVINAANVTVICTEKRKEQIRKAAPRKLYVIHNTPQMYPADDFVFPMKSQSNKMKVVYVGILAGLRMLKETVEVVSQMDDVEMHVGGFGELQEWMQNAADVYDNIYFYGKLQYHETLSLESQCDVMVAIYDPSLHNHRYAAPNKFYESLMLGRPIIMAENTGFDDIIVSNAIGEMTQYSKEGIKRALAALKTRMDQWREMGKRAQKVYDDSFSWEIMKKRISEMYEQL